MSGGDLMEQKVMELCHTPTRREKTGHLSLPGNTSGEMGAARAVHHCRLSKRGGDVS